MAVVQNLYQIFKIKASFLVENDCNIPVYTKAQGRKDDNIVSIGDNIIFQQLRYLHNDFRDHHELFNDVSKLRERMHAYKKAGDFKKASVLNQKISQVLFVKDIVNVIIDKKKSDFHKFRTKGFYMNGIHYVYLCSGSGQIRRNTATFVNEEYRDILFKRINCGLDEKTSSFVLAKYSAYFALAFSSILWVRTPRVCIIKDFIRVLPDQKVDFIIKDENDNGQIEERIMDVELNCADGQGLIDPEFAQLWAQDMDLPYLPCSFVARSCFIKGNLATFDFKDYAHQHGITTIRDRWGKEYNIDDIDVLLSESQFKTYKYYSSWQEYCDYAEKGMIHWGVARYNRHYDDEYISANYQYIQALTLSKEDVHELVQPTIKWIQQICSGDPLYSLLYAFGSKSDDTVYASMFGTAQTIAMKALVKNIDFLNDTYIQRKLYKSIAESINRAKLGKIWVRGNYQFMVADPVAQCQAALGLEPVGLLKANEVYSAFWDQKGVHLIDACRSPMIDLHEHNPMTVIDTAEARYWYKYMPSGIIYNTYDTSCARHSDSDYDGDIVMTTDNPYFLKGSNKSHNVITYEKGLAKTEKITVPNITKTVMKGFGTGVGGFSNTATCLYAMAAIFNKPGHEDQYNEIMRRIKLLREIVGQEIDRIKGADKPSLPSSWKKYEPILETDTQEEKLAKMRRNAMVISKKPYFFRYLYPELNQRFKQFEASYNQVSRDIFGIKFKKLLTLENKTPEQLNLVRKYQKYSPLITSDCTMNRLCREFENVDFDIQFAKDPSTPTNKKKVVSKLPTYASWYKDLPEDTYQQHHKIIKDLYKAYIARRQVKFITDIFSNSASAAFLDTEEYMERRTSLFDQLIDSLQTRLAESGISNEEFLYHCHKLSFEYANFNWGFAWDILDEALLDLIPQGKSFTPVHDINGKEYLGETYSLKEITKKDDIVIQNLWISLFGETEEPDDETGGQD